MAEDPASAKIISSNFTPKSKDRSKKKSGRGAAPVNTDDPGAPGGGGDSIPSFHRGGKVRKTGLARLKKGERVLTRKQQRRSGKSRG
jgi:hypothetical protein